MAQPVKLSHLVIEPEGGAEESLTPIIFLHGLTFVKESWEDVPQRIADETKRKAYLYDIRDHGESEYTDKFNFDLLIDDLFFFMDTMDLQKAILFGHGLGGLTALNAALRRPERVEKVIAEDMYPFKIPKERLESNIFALNLRKESIQNIPRNMDEEEAAKFSAEYMYDKLPDMMKQLIQRDDFYKMKVYLKRTPDGEYDVRFNLEAIIEALKDPETFSPEPTGKYDGPAYFIYAKESSLRVGDHKDVIRKLFPGAKLIEFEGTTNNPHLEFPDKFIDAAISCL